ncbi:MAG: hypothetical protein Kow0099_09440 [Candidatus Abyssubacteria bacterium]
MVKPPSNFSPAKHILLPLLILLFGILYFSLSYKGVFYAGDEGATVYHFEKTAEGAVQHRDFFSVYGMAFYVLGQYLFKWFGVQLIVTRTFMLILKLGMALLIYAVALRLTRPAFALLGSAGFIIWWGDPFIATTSYLYPSHISQFFGLLSLLFMLAYAQAEKRTFVLLAGLSAGLNSLFKPTVGVLNLFALMLFLFARELLLDMKARHHASGEIEPAPIGKVWIFLELVSVTAAIAVLFGLFAKFGADLMVFAYLLAPVCLVMAYLAALGLLVLRTGERAAIRENARKTAVAYLFLVAGFLFWQLVQAGYFAWQGAFGDFINTYVRTAAYYSEFGISLWHGKHVILLCLVTAAVALGLRAGIRLSTSSASYLKMLLGGIGAALTCAGIVSWCLTLDNPVRQHYLMWTVPLAVSVWAALFLLFTDTFVRADKGPPLTSMPLLLVAVYSAITVLDAFPRIDPGHFFMVMPPVFILSGLLAQRFHDMWTQYLPHPSAAGRILPRAMIAALAIGIFLPSLFMMLLFNVYIVPTPQGYRLHQHRVSLMPTYQPRLQRARGLELHVLENTYWQPLVMPKSLDFFDLVDRVASMTTHGDTLLCTTSWSFMLYFLTDRDCIEDKTNSYVWQTIMSISTSEAIRNYSEHDLIRLIEERRPAAIVAEDGTIEMKLFVMNWPKAWDYITTHYRLADRVGQFLIYTPKSEQPAAQNNHHTPS